MAQRTRGDSTASQLAALKKASAQGTSSIVNGISHQVNALSAPLEKGNLDIGPMEWRVIDTLKKSPHNKVFHHLKTPHYMSALTEDILNAGEITDPLLITPDNVIISGHSRLDIALSLFQEGYKQFEKVPVRVIATPLSEEERKERVYLANLSRVEIDRDLRLLLYSEMWPELYTEKRVAGRPASNDPDIPTVVEIAKKTGVTSRQVQRDIQIVQLAIERAEKEGRPVNVSDISASREQINKDRKEKEQEKQAAKVQEPPAATIPEDAVPRRIDNEEVLTEDAVPGRIDNEEVSVEEVMPGSITNEEVSTEENWVEKTNHLPSGEQWLRSIDELESILIKLGVCEDYWNRHYENIRDPYVGSKRKVLTRIKTSLESLISSIREEK